MLEQVQAEAEAIQDEEPIIESEEISAHKQKVKNHLFALTGKKAEILRKQNMKKKAL